VQEVVLPKTVHVVYGGQYLKWDALEAVAEMFNTPERCAFLLLQHAEVGRLAVTNMGNVRSMAMIRHSTAVHTSLSPVHAKFASLGLPNLLRRGDEVLTQMLSLSSLLKDFDSFKATKELDKVYALLSLACDGSEKVIVPDYTKSPQLLFTEVARHLISTGELFTVLSRAGIGNKRKYGDLPSWAPDWTTLTMGAEFNFGDPKYCKGAYNASGRSQTQITVLQDQNLLEVGALYLDDIMALSDVCPLHSEDDTLKVDSEGHVFNVDDLKAHYDWHSEAWSLATTHGRPPLGKRANLQEAFWRTLAGDTEGTSRPADLTLGEYYTSWIELISRWDSFDALPLPNDDEFWDFVGKAKKWGVLEGQGCSQRRFCVTKKGYLGLVPPGAAINDEIWVLLGAPTPHIFRHENSKESVGCEVRERTHELVGECYVDEMMDGEIFENNRDVKCMILK
jgi:hypothetical protein